MCYLSTLCLRGHYVAPLRLESGSIDWSIVKKPAFDFYTIFPARQTNTVVTALVLSQIHFGGVLNRKLNLSLNQVVGLIVSGVSTDD